MSQAAGLPNPVAGPSHSPADSELAMLRERLKVSDEWNVRLQNQIQELLRLPRNEVESMRERMQSPEIAIPLLQCYDAAIQEKAEENERLRKENAQLTIASEQRAGEHSDLSNAVRVAEELAQHVQSKAQEETHRAQSALRDAQAECNQLRQELSRALDAESEGKRNFERVSKQLATLKGEMDTVMTEKARLEEAVRAATLHRQQTQSAEGETLAQREAQKIQLSVLSHENEDRLEELERLRARMIQALRQAAESHTAHIKVVEERHALVVEQLRTTLKTQEMEIRRMRGQLAWADPNSGVLAGGSQQDGLLTSTTQLVEAQTRQAQEAEIKRLYSELSQAQTQRDDAIVRYEQLTSALRRQQEQHQLELHRQTAALAKGKEAEQARALQLERELAEARTDQQRLRDAQHERQQALDAARDAKEDALAAAQAATTREATTAAQLAECEQQLSRVEAAAKARTAALEQRVEATLADVNAAKARAYAEVERATQERDEARQATQTAQERLVAAQRALSEAQRDQQVTQTQMARLTDALALHKRQLAACDERLLTLQTQLETAKQQSRSAQLTMERLNLENARLTRVR